MSFSQSTSIPKNDLAASLGMQPRQITEIQKGLGVEIANTIPPWQEQEIRSYCELLKQGKAKSEAIAEVVASRIHETATSSNGHSHSISTQQAQTQAGSGGLTQAFDEARGELEDAAEEIGEQLGHAMTRVAIPKALNTFSADLKQASKQIASRIKGEVVDVGPLDKGAEHYLPDKL